jgi:pimeloyl-ACP methyl ester carboxylesterase
MFPMWYRFQIMSVRSILHRFTGFALAVGSILLAWRLVAVAAGGEFWPYYARLHGPLYIPVGGTVDVPMGYCAFPQGDHPPARSVASQMFTNIQRWTEMPKGGHFAAMEQPEALAGEVQAFFHPLR